MKRTDLKALLHLYEIAGLGPVRIRLLVDHFGSPARVFEASAKDIAALPEMDIKVAENIRRYERTDFGDSQIGEAERRGVKIVTLWDDTYPFLLKKIYDPPVFLFVKGTLVEGDHDAVAVVGTRAPTPYGQKVARALARGLASAGLTVVSGFARGVDAVAHDACLSAGGRTVAVLGSGLDVIYPAVNRRLVGPVTERGAMVSEFPFGTKPDAPNFPRRNRIISGLSHATIVVEAGNRSGAILTALNAVDQNREVFAVPGRLTDRKSDGCLRLIRLGATPVKDVEQIVRALNPRLKHPVTPVQRELKLDLNAEESVIYAALSEEPKHVDDIVDATELDPSRVLTLLLDMELKGVVIQLAGKQYIRA
ncbi:MAG: DNA-processing protein DprA [Fidelibacterota bacterium]